MTKALDKKIEDVMTSIYTELYAVSEPSVSWNYLLESAELNEQGQKIIPYMEIRKKLKEGSSGRSLSKEYNMSEGMISLIKNNKYWI